MRFTRPALALSLALLSACSVLKPSASGPGAAPGAAAPKETLAAEQRRLADLFRGTPVVFAMQADGSMRVTVPLVYSFDKGRYAVKPPLGAVLDRVAKSQRTEATRFFVTAPADPQTKGLMLATERANSTRDYLVGRGVDARRFSTSAVPSGDEVVIIVADTSAH